jgi:acyl-CoA thioester hydrolase
MLAVVGADFLGELAANGSAYVVSEAELKYRKPAHLGDALTVVSSVGEIRRAGVVVHQRVMRNADVIVEGRVTVVFVGPDWRPRRQPEAWITAFEAISGGAEARR